MSLPTRRWSIVLVAAAVLVGAACAADDTTSTGDPSTTTTTADGSPAGTEGTEAPPTSEAGGGETTTTAAGPTTSDAPTTSSPPSTGAGATTTVSAPKVDAASVEAFCALDQQLDDLAEQQLGEVDVDDPDSLRQAMSTFVNTNAKVIEQYVAAAPPEIEGDVETSMRELRQAIDDPAAFAALMTEGSEASERVSAFVDVNCA